MAVVHHVDGNCSNNDNINLVICNDRSYHNLLHKRIRAFKMCGKVNWLTCCRCLKYDDPKNLLIYGKQAVHRECNTKYFRKKLSLK
jgi:hypothetical protein